MDRIKRSIIAALTFVKATVLTVFTGSEEAQVKAEKQNKYEQKGKLNNPRTRSLHTPLITFIQSLTHKVSECFKRSVR